MINKIQSELIRQYSANFCISHVDFTCAGFPILDCDLEFLPKHENIVVYTIVRFMGQELSWSWTLCLIDLQRMGVGRFIETHKIKTRDLIIGYSLKQLGTIND